jgi:hypothetical protein
LKLITLKKNSSSKILTPNAATHFYRYFTLETVAGSKQKSAYNSRKAQIQICYLAVLCF